MSGLKPRTLWSTAAAALSLWLLACAPSPEAPERAVMPTEAEIVAGVEAWRTERDEGLRSDEGWLSLAGLFWLEEGESTFGDGDGNDLVFPHGKIAPTAGRLIRDGREVTLDPAPGAGLTVGGEPVDGPTPLAPDIADDGPTEVEAGSLLFYVIERGEQVGIRLKDRESPLLANFEGMEYFPVDPAWRISARYERFSSPRTLVTPNVLGTTSEEEIEGAVVFTVAGETFRLLPSGDPEEGFFLVFGDGTNGEETYGGGRFLYTEPVAADGSVVLDFNRAYCPPCVFTPWATCPLPPRENKLDLPIEAGEKTFAGLH